jgi:predicted Zn-dependent protease
MSALLYAYAVLAMARSHAPVTLTVDLTSGTTISGERTIKVTVASQNPVTQVEFYVGSDLRDNATATPYLFKFDSLGESDGDLKLRFKAYTTEGETGEKTVSIHVDNGESKGADYHVQQGRAALTVSDWKTAETEGRIALKIDPKSNPARIVLTRSYLGQRIYDKAQKYAEDAVSQDGNDVQALSLLSAVNIEIALGVVTKEAGDRKDVTASVRDALKNAVKIRRKVLDNAISAAADPTDEASGIAYADLAISAGRFTLAAQTLTQLQSRGSASLALYKRLAYVYLRLSQPKEAIDILHKGEFLATSDPEVNAILAVAYAEIDDATSSDASLAKAKQSGGSNPAPQMAEAYIALKFARSTGVRDSLPLNYDDASGTESKQKQAARVALSTALSGLLSDLGHRTETNYFAQSLENKLEEYDKADRYFQSAILAEPTNSDAFIEQGNRSIALSYRGKLEKDVKQQHYDSAETMFQTALVASPSSPAALTGLSELNSIEGNGDQAVSWAQAAVAADKNYAAGFAALSTAYSIASKSQRSAADALRKKNNDVSTSSVSRQMNEKSARDFETAALHLAVKAQEAGRAAASLDPRVVGYDFTIPLASWRYFNAGGRLPTLAPPTN